MPAEPTSRADSEGVRVLLQERQDNPVTREEYFRSVELLENESGVQDAGNLTITFDPSYQTLAIHYLRVHRNGASLSRLDLDAVKVIQPEPDLWGGIYTGEHTAVLFVEDLRVGDVLEYAFTRTGANPIIGDHYSAVYWVETYTAKDRFRLRVVWPSSRPLFLRSHGVSQPPRTNDWSEGRTYTWDWEDLKGSEYEDFVPYGHEPLPYVEFSDFESWSRVVEWALPLYSGATNALTVEGVQLLQDWRRSGASPAAVALSALEFVQDDLRYTGIELGPDSFRPATPGQTLVRRYGDCKAKSLLFCTLMKAAGIEAWPALVNTSSRQQVARRLPSPFAFNHVIVKLEVDDRPVWVDPTRSSQGGSLTNRYVPDYRVALLIKPGVSELEALPTPAPRQLLQIASSEFLVEDYQAPVRFTVTTVYHGAEADEMRVYLAGSSLSDISQDYLNYYARDYPGITNAGPLQVQDQRMSNELRVVEQYQIADLWQFNESTSEWEADFYPDNLIGMLTDPDTRVRKRPLRITYPLRREHTVVVRLPDDDWLIPSEEHVVEHRAFRLDHSLEGTGDTVRFVYACETLLREIPVEEVAGYLQKLDDFREILGDTLFRPDETAPFVLERINWLMVALTLLLMVTTAAAAVWAYFLLRTRIAPAVAAAPPLLSEQRLCGLGGWLTLVGIGLVLSPVSILANIGVNWASYFSQDVWQTVASPQGADYHPLWGPLLIAELTADILMLGMIGVLLPLFFGRRRAFPGMYIAFLIVNFLVLLADVAAVSFISPDFEQGESTGYVEALRAGAAMLIWSSYMIRSRRVKLTFVR